MKGFVSVTFGVNMTERPTCKLSGVEPQAYIEDVITKLVNGHLQSRIDELLPWAYAPKAISEAA